MNRTSQWHWLVLSAALITLPFATPTQAASTFASPQASQVLSQAELEQMLAPIALYPDSLLSHILISATYPLEVVQADRWLAARSQLSVEQVMAQAQNQGWDPSVKALLAFPTVLQKMAQDLEWTQKLGEAFLADESQVMDGIQSLRQQADKANSLRDMDNMAITRSNNQIIIEPARREIIYVPYYDPRVVYGTWRWGTAYPPVYWHHSNYAYRPGHSHFYWTPGIQISFNFFFSAFHWHNHKVVVIDHHHSHHYRPWEKYSVSHGAQPWKHKVEHRRGVGYHNPVVKQRYYAVSQQRDAHSSTSGKHPQFISQYSNSKPSLNTRDLKEREQQGDRTEQALKERAVKDRAVKERTADRTQEEHRKANPRDERQPPRVPNYQQTQAELAERRAASKQAAPTIKERHASDSRYRHDSQPLKSEPSRAFTTREPISAPVSDAAKRYPSRDIPARSDEALRRETQRPEPSRYEPSRYEQARPAPKPREETRIRQEPRSEKHIARTSEQRPRGAEHNQERRQRE